MNADINANSSQSEAETGNSDNISSEKQRNDNILYNEQDAGTTTPNIILNKNSEITQKDETMNANEVKENTDLSKVDSSLDLKNENSEKDILSSVMETEMDKLSPKQSTSVQQETEQMKCTTIENQATSSVSTVEGGNQPTSSVIFDRISTSEENNHAMSGGIMDVSGTVITEDMHPLPSRVSFNDNKNNTKDIDDSSDNQLVPDVICAEMIGYDTEMNESASGDQVVDQNNNETHKTSAEDEENMLIVKQISDGVLTDSMLDQEKKLHQEHLEEEKEMVTKVR